jgi:hypothetical protein
MSWQRQFEDRIEVDDRTLRTLRDAADYIMKLPKTEQASDVDSSARSCARRRFGPGSSSRGGSWHAPTGCTIGCHRRIGQLKPGDVGGVSAARGVTSSFTAKIAWGAQSLRNSIGKPSL